MNLQYMYSFSLCFKFDLNSNLSLLTRRRVASTISPSSDSGTTHWDILFPSSLSSNMIATYGLHRKVEIKEMICYIYMPTRKLIYGFLKYAIYMFACKETNI
jgi:hypothetical protein